ncbi:MAG: DAK2 domain-containing protein [Spirochaetia bacterium]|jgi:dihydroxyacetone kinase-like protein
MLRGKSKPSEKTIVDVLLPAAQAMKEAAASGSTLADAFRRSQAAAREGLSKSKEMIAEHGRASYY